MIIYCKDISIGYSEPIVTGINFSVSEGDYLCIVGENGAGKSTLMKTILGLQKPIEGHIEFLDGFKQTDIGYLPQQTDIQKDFPASIEEVVISGCQANTKYKFFYNNEDKKLAKKNMELMDIYDIRRKCYRELSGGQQQRVLLARALCAAKECLLLDEPVAGLDPKVTLDMYKLIDTLNKDMSMTIIMISHDIEATLKYATKVLYIGKELFFGSKSEFMNSKLGKKFLEV